MGRARLNLASEEPELEDALEDLQTAAKLDPQYGEAQLELANLHLAQNQPGAALSVLEDAARLLPGSPQVELTRARSLMAQENYKDALTAVNRALELDLTLLPAYLVRGEIHALLRQPEKALADLTIYTRYAGGNIDAQTLVLLGEAWFAAGDVDAALNTLDRALVENPRLISALMQRGRIHLDEGNLDEAEADYDAAVKLRRDSFEANAGLAQVWMAQGFYGDAYKRWEEIQKYMETDADQAVLWYYRAICLRELNFPDLAIRDWTRLLEDLPEENVPAELRLAAREMLEAIYTPTPTPTYAPTPVPAATPTPTRVPPDQSETEKWIEVDLSEQRLYAHESQTTVLNAVVSTGTWQYPTVTGRFRVSAKYRAPRTTGPGYDMDNVPWSTILYACYATHGTSWLNYFSQPMTHGPTNLTPTDATFHYP